MAKARKKPFKKTASSSFGHATKRAPSRVVSRSTKRAASKKKAKAKAPRPVKAAKVTRGARPAKARVKLAPRKAAPRAAAKKAKAPKAGAKKPAPQAKLRIVASPSLAQPPTAASLVSRGTPTPAPRGSSRAMAIDAARLMHDDKCEDVVVLDVRDLCQVSDYIVIGSGTSDRQMRAVSSHLKETGLVHNYTPFRTDIDDRATWCLVDFVDVVAHIFEPNTRAHYDIEMLWGDAPRIDWQRAAGEGPLPVRAFGASRSVAESSPA
ncbi:MAG: ribosome silencing factor [Phycisphaerales bacterium]